MSERRITTVSGVVARLEGHGPPLVLVAGLGQTAEVWDAVLPRLTSTRTCVLIDNRGVGAASGRTDVSIEGMAADIAEVIEETGVPTAVLGWSMGGAVALTLALSRPDLVSELVLLSTAARRSEVQLRWASSRVALAESGVARETAELAMLPWLFSGGLLTDHSRTTAIARANARAEPVPVTALRAQVECFDDFDVTQRLSEVAVPTLVVVGAQDLVTPVADAITIALGVPGADLIVLPHGGHAVVLETPAEALSAVLGFLHATPAPSANHLVHH